MKFSYFIQYAGEGGRGCGILTCGMVGTDLKLHFNIPSACVSVSRGHDLHRLVKFHAKLEKNALKKECARKSHVEITHVKRTCQYRGQSL